jgi:cob(I)alamin adenosyltransferase
MLYTKKGDDGKTMIFGCDQRISKSTAITEALGSLDEANSFLGICKAKIHAENFAVGEVASWAQMIENIQNDLFIIQANVAGADKEMKEGRVGELEDFIKQAETNLPPIKTFLVAGANLVSANFDFARTLVRRAERRTVAVSDEGVVKISPMCLVYLNRLSSVLYAMARLSAYKSGIKEESPRY